MNRVPADERQTRAIAASDIAAAAQLACLLEATAPKPGNVSPGRGFADTSYEDFLTSAAAIGGPLSGAGDRPLGTTVRLAIDATARWCSSNTNLGIVLLLAPLARAAFAMVGPTEVRLKPDTTGNETDEASASEFTFALRDQLRHVLTRTTVDDAREVYAAIRHAAPAGLGRVHEQDVAHEPDVTLLEAMQLAADRDGIAREYVTTFASTFEIGAPALMRARHDGLTWADAIVETFLVLLAAAPDTHIARRGGRARAEEVSGAARTVLDAGGVRSDQGRQALDRMDRELRDPRHIANPGTTADLTAASIFVVLLTAGKRFGSGVRLKPDTTHGI